MQGHVLPMAPRRFDEVESGPKCANFIAFGAKHAIVQCIAPAHCNERRPDCGRRRQNTPASPQCTLPVAAKYRSRGIDGSVGGERTLLQELPAQHHGCSMARGDFSRRFRPFLDPPKSPRRVSAPNCEGRFWTSSMETGV